MIKEFKNNLILPKMETRNIYVAKNSTFEIIMHAFK